MKQCIDIACVIYVEAKKVGGMSSHGHVHVPHVHVPHVHVPWGAPHHPSGEKSFLDDLDLASPLHTGYMFKEAHTHLVFHKRFFVLFPKVLVYYEKEADYNRDVAKGTLEVLCVASVSYIPPSVPMGYGVHTVVE